VELKKKPTGHATPPSSHLLHNCSAVVPAPSHGAVAYSPSPHMRHGLQSVYEALHVAPDAMYSPAAQSLQGGHAAPRSSRAGLVPLPGHGIASYV
jgi:hypothetical protein